MRTLAYLFMGECTQTILVYWVIKLNCFSASQNCVDTQKVTVLFNLNNTFSKFVFLCIHISQIKLYISENGREFSI